MSDETKRTVQRCPAKTADPEDPKSTVVNGPVALSAEEQENFLAGQWTMVRDEDKKLIDDLAKLKPSSLDYHRRRPDAAKSLGVGVGPLDRIVKARREELRRELDADQELPFEHWATEPWPEPVDGDALIAQIVRRLNRHIAMTAEQGLTGALWSVMTWAHQEAAIYSPVLLVTSPEPGSGKTELLTLLSFLACRGYHMVDPTPAAVYQTADANHPTLCIDDADTIFVGNHKLRSIINAGWTRSSAKVPRAGSKGISRWFSIWCPKAFGLIGRRLPASTLSRCVVIEMKRKLPDEHAEAFSGNDDQELKELRQKALRWANDSIAALKAAIPAVPPGFGNRLAANWRLLLAIADLAGGEWPELARRAAVVVAGVASDEDDSQSIQLLAAVKTIRDAQDRNRITSAELITELCKQDGPWAEFKGRQPITESEVARLLRPHRIKPKQMRVGKQNLRGYAFADFEEAIKRYVD